MIDPVTPAAINEEFVRNKCEYFLDVQLWPLLDDVDPNRWLSNFRSDEVEHAAHLLNAFIYLSEALVNQIFLSAFQGLSRHVLHRGDPFMTARLEWQEFNSRVHITHVEGEVPNVTDSGYLFDRKARQLLELPEERILAPADALRLLILQPGTPVVFVDDFVGTGEQFIETWHRQYELGRGVHVSFAQVVAVRRERVFYCPVVATSGGVTEIAKYCAGVLVSPGHLLPDRYSALAPDSLVWPSHLQATGAEFLRATSERAGIPDTDGISVDDWRGYRKLGLSLAFSHSVPDATLPIFYWEQRGWQPLVRKR